MNGQTAMDVALALLDGAIKTGRAKMGRAATLADKLALLGEEKRLAEARRFLRLGYFDAADAMDAAVASLDVPVAERIRAMAGAEATP